jgi:regulator of nucleoside diphosphate kinase
MNREIIPDYVKPSITLSAGDYEKLSFLTQAAMTNMPEEASVLAEELGRARVLPDGPHPTKFVAMHSSVRFRDDTTGRLRTVTVVYPNEADISQRKISVLTPVGTALIGLSVGDSITWDTPSGESRQLTVLDID